MTMETDLLTQADVGPGLADGLMEILNDPTSRAYALFEQGKMAVRARCPLPWSGELEVLLLATGELQLVVWRADGTARPTDGLACFVFLGAESIPLRDGGSYWRAQVPLSRVATVEVLLSCGYSLPEPPMPVLEQ